MPTAPPSQPEDAPLDSRVITVRGAAEHNLRHVDVDIPKHQLVVFSGVSGSGKSSLAFDTLYAEGQRRYVESLSAYARQFLGQMDKPRYDRIGGLSPTIAIEQKTTSSNPRSTVGTVTEVYDYLRVLFARVGVQHCHSCGDPVGRQSPQEAAGLVTGWPAGTRFTVLAPVIRERKGAHLGVLDQARRDGFVRVRVDGEIRGLDETFELDPKRKHTIEVVVDRLSVKDDVQSRLVDSLETAFAQGQGLATVTRADTGQEILFSERNHCAACDISFPDLSPQLFSFNSPQGMCPACQGLGTEFVADPARLVPDPELTLLEGAVKPWATALDPETPSNASTRYYLDAFKAKRVDPGKPWKKLTTRQRTYLLFDDRGERPAAGATRGRPRGFEGAAHQVARLHRETYSDEARVHWRTFLRSVPCRHCEGARLRVEARNVRVGVLDMPTAIKTPVHLLRRLFDALGLDGTRAEIAREVLREVHQRLRFLDDVGLGYLALSRASGTLSGGESQRIRLASQIGTELTGVIYVLDEPSIGLHPRDTQRLLGTLRRLRDIGNSVVVVEHDSEIILAADFLVDFGPGAGTEGGRVVAAAAPDVVAQDPASLTGAYLSGRRSIPTPTARRKTDKWLQILGARHHNLQGVDVQIPLGVFTAVTGVSGAGKSSLINGILRPYLSAELHGAKAVPGDHDAIVGVERLDKIVDIDQRPIGRTPRSNPATYTKVLDEIRKVFAATREARMYGYTAGRFSFNVKGGRCDECNGDGAIRVEMHFLPDVYVQCEVCKGKRFNDATLRVTFKGKNIADVLALTIAEALPFFEAHKKIRRIVQTLVDVGLGYVSLGQPSNTLSGGEAQRVKLARELARVQTGNTLYVLDEPSMGLHLADIERLLIVVDRLVKSGNTVVMIEHHLDIIKVADWVIDLGPEGGDAGGFVVATGTPEEVAAVAASHTGRYLADVLS